MTNCKHEWWTYGTHLKTHLGDRSIALICDRCKCFARVMKHTDDEWEGAVTSHDELQVDEGGRIVDWPGYRWTDEARVEAIPFNLRGPKPKYYDPE